MSRDCYPLQWINMVIACLQKRVETSMQNINIQTRALSWNLLDDDEAWKRLPVKQIKTPQSVKTSQILNHLSMNATSVAIHQPDKLAIVDPNQLTGVKWYWQWALQRYLASQRQPFPQSPSYLRSSKHGKHDQQEMCPTVCWWHLAWGAFAG